MRTSAFLSSVFDPCSIRGLMAFVIAVAVCNRLYADEGLHIYDPYAAPMAYSEPAVELPVQMHSVRVLGGTDSCVLPGDPNQPVVIDNDALLPPIAQPDPLLSGVRQRFIQQILFTSTYEPRLTKQSIGFTDLDLSTTLAVPVPLQDLKTALMVTPEGDVNFVDGPVNPDLPPRLFDANLQVAWLGQLPDNFVFDIGVQPGFHWDGVNTTNYGFRTPYYFTLGYRVTPNLLIGAGAANLDRHDVHWLPLAGLIYIPDENTRFEFVPPRPRIAHRFEVERTYERWWYFAAEFGGGEWAIRRASGADDVVSEQEYKITNGVMQVSTNNGFGWRAEYGYVFGRHVDYASPTPSFDPHNTVLAQIGIEY
jgi:hypothetical protein